MNCEKSKATIQVDYELYEKFSNAIKETKHNSVDDAVMYLMSTYNSFIHNKKLNKDATEDKKVNKPNSATYYAKAYERIPIWANKPHQKNSMIVWSFFKAEEIDGFATINLMKGLCIDRGMSEHQFKINYASMKLDSSNSHGKVFEDDGENVWIWEEIKPRLMQYKNAFYKGE